MVQPTELRVRSAVGADLAPLIEGGMLADALSGDANLAVTSVVPPEIGAVAGLLDDQPDADLLLLSAGGLLGAVVRDVDVDEVRAALAALMDRARQRPTIVIVANGSTIDPGAPGSDATDVELVIHRFDAALLRASQTDGLSVLDVDRTLAVLGAAGHVVAPLRYDEVGLRAIADELAFVVRDYGLLDERPLLVQQGRR